MDKECSSCGRRCSKYSNSWHKLCTRCNAVRLASKSRSVRSRAVVRSRITLDEDTYKMLWDTKEHVCEECGVHLGDDFRDESGSVIARYRYSHILPKSTHPEFRHNIRNFNILCLEHHRMWDFGDKKKMRIWEKNQKIVSELMDS